MMIYIGKVSKNHCKGLLTFFSIENPSLNCVTPDKIAGLYGTLIYNDSLTERKCSQCLNFEMPNSHLLKNNLQAASFKALR